MQYMLICIVVIYNIRYIVIYTLQMRRFQFINLKPSLKNAATNQKDWWNVMCSSTVASLVSNRHMPGMLLNQTRWMIKCWFNFIIAKIIKYNVRRAVDSTTVLGWNATYRFAYRYNGQKSNSLFVKHQSHVELYTHKSRSLELLTQPARGHAAFSKKKHLVSFPCLYIW